LALMRLARASEATLIGEGVDIDLFEIRDSRKKTRSERHDAKDTKLRNAKKKFFRASTKPADDLLDYSVWHGRPAITVWYFSVDEQTGPEAVLG